MCHTLRNKKTIEQFAKMLKESDQTERGCGMQGLRSPACLDRPIGQTDRPRGQTYRTNL